MRFSSIGFSLIWVKSNSAWKQFIFFTIGGEIRAFCTFTNGKICFGFEYTQIYEILMSCGLDYLLWVIKLLSYWVIGLLGCGL